MRGTEQRVSVLEMTVSEWVSDRPTSWDPSDLKKPLTTHLKLFKADRWQKIILCQLTLIMFMLRSMSIFPFPIFTNLSLISNLKDSNVNSISVRAWLWRAPSRLYLICRRLTGIKMIKYVGKVWITGSDKPVSRNIHKEETVSTNKNSEGYNSKLGSKIKQHPNSNWSKNLRQVS